MRRVLRVICWNVAELQWIVVYSTVAAMYNSHVIGISKTFVPTVSSVVAFLAMLGSIRIHDWAVKHKP